MVRVVLLFAALALLRAGNGKDLFWAQNSNWNNDDNWSLGRVPCKSDIVDFSKVGAVNGQVPVIYFNTNSTVRQLILPVNGRIILKPSVTIRLAANESCEVPSGSVPMAADGETNNFVGVMENKWECPSNWVDNTGTAATQVPCGNDNVIFPEDSAFSYVISALENIIVRSLMLRNSMVSSFTDYSEFMVNVSVNGDCGSSPDLCPCVTVDDDCNIVSSVPSSTVSTTSSQIQPTPSTPVLSSSEASRSSTPPLPTSTPSVPPNVGVSTSASVPNVVPTGPTGPVVTVGAASRGGGNSGMIVGVVVAILVVTAIVIAVIVIAVIIIKRRRGSLTFKHSQFDNEENLGSSKDSSGMAAYDNPTYAVRSDPMDQLVPDVTEQQGYDNPLYSS